MTSVSRRQGSHKALLLAIAHYSWHLCIVALDGVSLKYLSYSVRRCAQRAFRLSTIGRMVLERRKRVRWEVGAWAEEALLVTGATHEIYQVRVRDAADRRMMVGGLVVARA